MVLSIIGCRHTLRDNSGEWSHEELVCPVAAYGRRACLCATSDIA
jgi:hypothetical protein